MRAGEGFAPSAGRFFGVFRGVGRIELRSRPGTFNVEPDGSISSRSESTACRSLCDNALYFFPFDAGVLANLSGEDGEEGGENVWLEVRCDFRVLGGVAARKLRANDCFDDDGSGVLLCDGE